MSLCIESFRGRIGTEGVWGNDGIRVGHCERNAESETMLIIDNEFA